MAKDDQQAAPKGHLTKAERIGQAQSKALEASLKVREQDLQLAQYDSIPVDDRPLNWETERAQIEAVRAREQHKLKHAHGFAHAIRGKDLAPKEREELKRQTDAAERQTLTENARAWEAARDGHEMNLEELKARPEDLREHDHDEQLRGNADAIVLIDRALAAANARLAQLGDG